MGAGPESRYQSVYVQYTGSWTQYLNDCFERSWSNTIEGFCLRALKKEDKVFVKSVNIFHWKTYNCIKKTLIIRINGLA